MAVTTAPVITDERDPIAVTTRSRAILVHRFGWLHLNAFLVTTSHLVWSVVC